MVDSRRPNAAYPVLLLAGMAGPVINLYVGDLTLDSAILHASSMSSQTLPLCLVWRRGREEGKKERTAW
jgi:hypothetical protein